MTDSRELKPCPLCPDGGDVDREFSLDSNGVYDPGCMKCGCTAPIEAWQSRPKQIDPTSRQHILDELAEYIGDCEFITDDDIKAVTFDSMCQFIEEKRAVRFITETGGIDHDRQ